MGHKFEQNFSKKKTEQQYILLIFRYVWKVLRMCVYELDGNTDIRTEGEDQECYTLRRVSNILITIITAETYSVHDQLT
jgi:hypothetical protein